MTEQTKVISFCLWGSNPKYTIGAIRNAELALEIYPGWETWFYVAGDVPIEITDKLMTIGAKVLTMGGAGKWSNMLWRFYPANYESIIMLSRDTDSRLNYREKGAVDEWLAGDKDFHIMRDHPFHATPIMGGMWGARNGILKNIDYWINEYAAGDHYQTDQEFLMDVIYPKVIDNACVHDPFFDRRDFPSKRINTEFVGDVFDEYDVRHPDFWKYIQKAEEHKPVHNLVEGV